MYKAIKYKRLGFVNLFLENNFSLRNFLTNRVLLKLFNDDISGSVLDKLLRKETFLNKFNSTEKRYDVFTFTDVGKVIEYLMDDFYQHKFTKKPYSKIDAQMALRILKATVSF